jgi:hypothetical protein
MTDQSSQQELLVAVDFSPERVLRAAKHPVLCVP